MRHFLFFALILSSCNAQQIQSNDMNNSDYWHFKPFGQDSILGIGTPTISNKSTTHKNKIVVALIDSDVDVLHEYLNKHIWSNNDEISKNDIDDDHNGYVDDKHGWNFLASGELKLVKYANNSSIRYTKEHQDKYKKIIAKKKLDLNNDEKLFIEEYNNAKESQNKELAELVEYRNYISWYESSTSSSDSLLSTYGISRPYNESFLDSLFNKVYTVDEDEFKGRLVYFALDDLKNNRNKQYMESVDFYEKNTKYATNVDFNENEVRKLLKGSSSSSQFGSPNVNSNVENEIHGTEMAGIIIKSFSKVLEESRSSENIEIMVLSIFPENGAEFGEDLAKAVRYAVDNGATIINYSSTLNYIVKPELVYSALEYAEQKDVLFVTSAGNTGNNLDEVIKHPRSKYKDFELSNLIMVGGIDSKLGLEMVPTWANYGKHTVDLFAPATNFTTTIPDNYYHEATGSSVATAMVTGIAASIKNTYPNLSAVDLKDIILNSVSKYEGKVNIGGQRKIEISFDELSRTGGILNAKQAFELASKK